MVEMMVEMVMMVRKMMQRWDMMLETGVTRDVMLLSKAYRRMFRTRRCRHPTLTHIPLTQITTG